MTAPKDGLARRGARDAERKSISLPDDHNSDAAVSGRRRWQLADAIRAVIDWSSMTKRPPAGSINSSDDKSFDALIAQYEGADARRSQNFTFFWQAVALSVAAQAFLFVIALDHATSRIGRIIAATLSFVVSIASLVLMRSQKNYQRVEGLWMDTIEEAYDLPERMWHEATAEERYNRVVSVLKSKGREVDPNSQDISPGLIKALDPKTAKHPFAKWWRRHPVDASAWWCFLLWLFMVAALIVIVLATWWPSLLSQ
jgi:hypothetical protein